MNAILSILLLGLCVSANTWAANNDEHEHAEHASARPQVEDHDDYDHDNHVETDRMGSGHNEAHDHDEHSAGGDEAHDQDEHHAQGAEDVGDHDDEGLR